MNQKQQQSTPTAGHGFRILGVEIDDARKRHIWVGYPTHDGGEERTRVLRGLLYDARKARFHFADLGAVLPDDDGPLFKALRDEQLPEAVAVTRQGGWHGEDFVTPFGTYVGQGAEPRTVFDASHRLFRTARQAGTIDGYRNGIRPFLEASDYVLLGMLLPLTAACAARIGRTEAFCVCLSQHSSTGKTLTLRVAQSLFDRANEADLTSFGDTMGATLNSLHAFGGLTVSYGDIKSDLNMKAALQKMRTSFFNAAGGTSRQSSTEGPLPDPQFLIPFISAEHSLVSLFAANGMQFEGGEAVRILDIPVPTRDEGGIFENNVLFRSGDLADRLGEFVSQQHGTVLRSWIEQLVHLDKGKLQRAVIEQEAAFRAHLGNFPSHHDRIAKQFALIAAVGHVAARARLVPLDPGSIHERVERLFWRTLRSLRRSDTELMALWTRFFALVDTDLPKLTRGLKPKRSPELGFRRDDGRGEFLCLKRESLIAATGSNFVDDVFLPELRRAGVIKPDKTGSLTVLVEQEGMGRARYYKVPVAAFDALKSTMLGGAIRP